MKWLDDPRLHNLMTYLGKRVDGKYTRKSLAAEKVNACLVQVELRRQELETVKADLASLSEEFDSLTRLIRDRDRTINQIKIGAVEAQADLQRQNPSADTSSIARDSEAMTQDVEKQ